MAYSDGIPAGCFGDWRTDTVHKWKASIGRDLTEAEEIASQERLDEAKRKRDEQRLRLNRAAAKACTAIWEATPEADTEHPYLKRKGILPHGVRQTSDGRLLCPLYSSEGEISTLQYISPDGRKQYHPGGAAKGSFWWLGDMGDAKRIYIAEGFATAASIHEVTGSPVVIAYSAGNLEPVTGTVRGFSPAAELVLVADNDASGTGQRAAEKAAEAHQAQMIIPPEIGDANDYLRNGGDLLALLEQRPRQGKFLVWISEVEMKDPEWIMKGIIEADSKVMVFGETGSGKSFLTIDWACSVATGTAWHGHVVKKPGAVAYLASEGFGGIRKRIAAWEQEHGIAVEDLLLSRGISLMTQVDELIADFKLLGIHPMLIIVDTLNSAMPGGDEQNNKDAGEVIAQMTKISRTFPGCSVLLVHHPGHADKDRARGASGWDAGMDITFRVEGKASTKEVKLVNVKMKEGELMPKPINLKKKQVHIQGRYDEDGIPITSCVLVRNMEEDRNDPMRGKGVNARLVWSLLTAPDPTYQHKEGDGDLSFAQPLGSRWVETAKARELICQAGHTRQKFYTGLEELRKAKLIEVEYGGTEKKPTIDRLRIAPGQPDAAGEPLGKMKQWLTSLMPAWKLSGGDMTKDMYPYITREGWKEMIRQNNPDVTDEHLGKFVDDPVEGSLIRLLVDKHIITPHKEGFKVTGTEAYTAMTEQARLDAVASGEAELQRKTYDLLTRIWEAGGKEWDEENDHPCLTLEGWETCLREDEPGLSSREVGEKLDPDNEESPAGKLLRQGMITPYRDGYKVTDADMARKMALGWLKK